MGNIYIDSLSAPSNLYVTHNIFEHAEQMEEAFGGADEAIANVTVLAVVRVGVAGLLLRLSILTIRLMQWLYNQRLIRRESTEYFFHFAKGLDARARRITAQIERDDCSSKSR